MLETSADVLVSTLRESQKLQLTVPEVIKIIYSIHRVIQEEKFKVEETQRARFYELVFLATERKGEYSDDFVLSAISSLESNAENTN